MGQGRSTGVRSASRPSGAGSPPGRGRRGLGELGLDRGEVHQLGGRDDHGVADPAVVEVGGELDQAVWSFWAAGSVGELNEPMVTRLEKRSW